MMPVNPSRAATMESRTTARGQLRRRRNSIAGRGICRFSGLKLCDWRKQLGMATRRKTFLNSTRPSDSRALLDLEIPEAQLASNLGVCLVDPNTRQVTVVYGPL